MAAERLHDAVVARRQQRAAHGARGAIVLHLELMLGVPAGVIAADGDDRDTVADGRIELERVEPERAVAERGDDRELRPRELGAERHRHGAADRSGRAVDQPVASFERGLAPLAELTAVAHEDATGLEARLDRGADAQGMERRGWRSSQILPRRRPRDPRGLDFLRPRAALPDALTRCRHELTSDGARIGGQGQRQTLARSWRRHVNNYEPAALGKGRRPAEAQREV